MQLAKCAVWCPTAHTLELDELMALRELERMTSAAPDGMVVLGTTAGDEFAVDPEVTGPMLKRVERGERLADALCMLADTTDAGPTLQSA